MRCLGICLAAAAMCAAQTPAAAERPPALVRGILLERDAPVPEGEFSVRRDDNRVFRYRFDRNTYVEREHDLIDVARLRPGDKVEVVSDAIPGFTLRYARTVHVLEIPGPPPRLTGAGQGRYRAYRNVEDRTIPLGSLTYSGVVFRITPERILIHTRDGEQALAIGKDTRYVQDGEVVPAGALKPNTRVFVRAGRDLYDQVEAYQVMWGSILAPQ